MQWKEGGKLRGKARKEGKSKTLRGEQGSDGERKLQMRKTREEKTLKGE